MKFVSFLTVMAFSHCGFILHTVLVVMYHDSASSTGCCSIYDSVTV